MFVLTGILLWLTFYVACFGTTKPRRPTQFSRIKLPPKLTRTWFYSKRSYSTVLKQVCDSEIVKSTRNFQLNQQQKNNSKDESNDEESRYTFYVKYK